MCFFITGGMMAGGKDTQAQTYTPVAVTGFNADCVAESGSSATLVTSTGIDIQQKILYAQTFASANSITNGLVNNGLITETSRSYQLMPYNGSNCLYMSASAAQPNTVASGTLTLNTPAAYSKLCVLGFSTEQTSTISLVFNFTDGTTQAAGNFTYPDWFGGTPYVVQGIGRIPRQAAGPYTNDGSGVNPRFYRIDPAITCANQAKLIRSITFSYVSGGGNASRAVIMAVSGVAYNPVVFNPVITNATCGNANGSIALNATGGLGTLSYSWATTPPQSGGTATSLGGGIYSCIVVDNGTGCSFTYNNGVVTQVPLPNMTATPAPASICRGNSTTISTSITSGTATNYTWSPGSLSGQTVTVSPTATTTYTVTATDNNNCPLSAVTTVTVKPTPTAVFTATPPVICLGSTNSITYIGTATAGATYTWNFDGATVQTGTGAGPYTVAFGTAGIKNITLQVTDNGCPASSTATQTVTVEQPPTADFSVTPASICQGQVVNVAYTGTAPAGSNFAWTWGGGTVLTGSGSGPYTVSFNTAGTINLAVTSGTCNAVTSSKPVTVTPLPDASFTADTLSGCDPLLVRFTSTSQNATSLLWNFGDGNTSTTSPAVTHGFTAGSYTVWLRAGNGNCADTSLPKTVTVAAPPTAGFSAMPDINTPVQLSKATFAFTSVSQGANGYNWFFGDNGTASIANPTHRYNLPGRYTVKLVVSNAAGCTDSISKFPFIVLPDSALHIPNAFSPNGDGINDIWDIRGLAGYADSRTEIFDRYGQLIFNSTGYAKPWDGKHRNTPAPVGTYYYIITYNNMRYAGWVMLLR